MLKSLEKVLVTILQVGVLISSMHVLALMPAAVTTSSSSDFAAKINAELHTHHEMLATRKPVQDQMADPRSFRKLRSHEARIAETEPDASCWDAYDTWVGISV